MGSIAEALMNVLKLLIVLALTALLLASLNGLLSFLGSLVFGSIIVEFFGILSCCMPFDALAVFGSLMSVCVAILSFMIARKIYDVLTWNLSAV